MMNFTRVLWLIVIQIIIGCSSLALADENTKSDAQMRQEALEAAIEAKSGFKSKTENKISNDRVFPDPIPTASSDPLTRKMYEQSLQSYYQYRKTGLEHRSKVFHWQLLSARIIFIIVLVVVATGIGLAVIQFRADLERLKLGTTDAMPNSEIEASATGIRISSSVIGLIILALSLAFFYLYLIYVFPIEEIL